jgi:hypothetical protein
MERMRGEVAGIALIANQWYYLKELDGIAAFHAAL